MQGKNFFEQNKNYFAAAGGFFVTYFAVSMLGGKPCTAFFTGLVVGVGVGVGYDSEIANDLRKQLQESINGKQQ
jgi:hypothetical protein